MKSRGEGGEKVGLHQMCGGWARTLALSSLLKHPQSPFHVLSSCLRVWLLVSPRELFVERVTHSFRASPPRHPPTATRIHSKVSPYPRLALYGQLSKMQRPGPGSQQASQHPPPSPFHTFYILFDK